MDHFNATTELAGATWSEKLDGVCACWDGQGLTSRDGHRIAAPDWFLGLLPTEACTGEIWAGRGNFETVLSVTQRGAGGDWSRLVFVPHDRIKQQAFGTATPEQVMASVVAKGGEGIVIRTADGAVSKLKPSIDDDAAVIGYTPGTGRNADTFGALIVQDREGRTFKLSAGLTFIERENPPAIGAIVTFSFCGRTRNGKPRHAVFAGQRFERSFV